MAGGELSTGPGREPAVAVGPKVDDPCEKGVLAAPMLPGRGLHESNPKLEIWLLARRPLANSGLAFGIRSQLLVTKLRTRGSR